ncbi:MAG: hypothetical protein J3K34DRAFT_520896 [Monoraphidium minutum]|nr:MAG: hypothetical protein J3K34DRAFT_520896 [Monoraphidium minutum]
MASIGFQYPMDAFRETHELMDSLIASYQVGAKEDVDAVRDVQRMVEDTLAAAAEREQQVQQIVKALSSKIRALESEADYSEAKAAHARDVAGLNEAVRADRAALAQISEDTRVTADQRAEMQRQRQQLAASKAELQQQAAEEEPRKVHQISLYAHITGLAFALDTINAPVHKATISDPAGSGELRTVSVDAAGRTPFETANEVWSLL